MEGPLSKWTNVMKGWQFRWFVLDDNAGLLSYYTSKEKMVRGARRGCVRLKAAIVGIDDEDDSTFTITVDGKTFHFQSQDNEEREMWIRALEETILRHSTRLKKWNLNRASLSIADFESKLTEGDAYLQLLISQEAKLNELYPSSETANNSDMEGVVANFNRVIESVKKCIVLLQVAKNTAFPVNGMYQVKSVDSDTPGREDANQTGYERNSVFEYVDPYIPIADIQSGIEVGREVNEVSRKSNANLFFLPHLPNLVPETSYSSSEDEDFFDADDFVKEDSSVSSPKSYFDAVENFKSNSSISDEVTGKSLDMKDFDKLSCQSTSEIQLNYDAMYEDDDDEVVSLEGHGSIIQHLISQVKIGMDLTKVTLPTFILERRSLLEMYADFFAHPDLFCGINSYESPKDRMVQVLKWYLSAFHAGRKSEVAKKPYNPILGEIFRCTWDLSHTDCAAKRDEDCVADPSLVPWAKSNDLAFVAEQVSHHPPVSAFYAENARRNISFCGHIWTKSKFLGLSVCVNNIGQGCVSLLDRDEEYILNFPSGYGRSILTVPWIELGGTCQISCGRTGYYANIQFLTKPFYGGKKHRISAEVFSPGDKKPFINVDGEWNGKMEARWSDGRVEDFIDTQSLPVLQKTVLPIAEQLPNESRNLWREVTAGLKFNNIHEATRAKVHLEQKQRQEAKERKDNKEEWNVKHFTLEADNWLYRNPLQKRVKY